MTLGEQLAQTSDLLVELIIATPDVEKAKKLRTQLTEILSETAKLVENNVDNSTPEYDAATKALDEINADIKVSIKDLEKTAETIKKVAVVIQVLAKVAKTAT